MDCRAKLYNFGSNYIFTCKITVNEKSGNKAYNRP